MIAPAPRSDARCPDAAAPDSVQTPVDGASSGWVELPGPQATDAVAGRLAQTLKALLIDAAQTAPPRFLLTLNGDLGAGKTHFAQALLKSLGVQGRVRSPSYTLVEPYSISGLTIHHFDLYRFSDPAHWADAGFDDILDEGGLLLMEWPQRAAGLLPPADLAVHLLPGAHEEARRLQARAGSKAGRACLSAFDMDAGR